MNYLFYYQTTPNNSSLRFHFMLYHMLIVMIKCTSHNKSISTYSSHMSQKVIKLIEQRLVQKFWHVSWNQIFHMYKHLHTLYSPYNNSLHCNYKKTNKRARMHIIIGIGSFENYFKIKTSQKKIEQIHLWKVPIN